MLDDSDVTPHGYILGILRETEKFDQHRYDAAKTLLPYVVPKLASIQANITHDYQITHEEALQMLIDEDEEA